MHPWGEEADDYRTALLATMFANSKRDPKKRSKAYQLRDFILWGMAGGQSEDSVLSTDTMTFLVDKSRVQHSVVVIEDEEGDDGS